MKRLQIMIEEDVDDVLARMAFERGVSKAALIRHFVRQHVEPAPALATDRDPIWAMAGADDFEPADVDEVVYR